MLKWYDALQTRVVGHVENHPTPFGRYLLLFFALLSIRLTLEFFSSHRLFTFDDVVHIGLWFVFIVLAMLLQLHFFSGERIGKVSRLSIVFFLFAWSAPIFDLLTSGGVAARMNYLSLNSPRQILWSYLTVGGSSLLRGATLGIRIEIVLLVLACFNYVRLKSGSVTRAFFGAWSIYSVLFLSGAVPLLLGALVHGLGLEYQADDRSTLLFLFSVDLTLLFVALWRHSSDRIRQILAAIPWGAVLIALLHAGIGAGLARHGYPDNASMNPTTLFWFPLTLALAICLAAFAALSALESRVGFEAERNERTGNGLFFLILAIGAMLSPRLFFVSTLIWALLFLRGEPPLRLDRVPVARNLLVGMLFVGAALFGFVALGGPMVGFPGPWILCLLAVGSVSGLFADLGRAGGDVVPWLESWSDDRRRNFHRLAIALVPLGFVVIGGALVPRTPDRMLLALFAVAPIVLLGSRPKQTQWIAAALVPAYCLLVRVAWETPS